MNNLFKRQFGVDLTRCDLHCFLRVMPDITALGGRVVYTLGNNYVRLAAHKNCTMIEILLKQADIAFICI